LLLVVVVVVTTLVQVQVLEVCYLALD